MTIFRPCIDLHNGAVKQIVGGTLTEDNANLCTNFESESPASYYAELYRNDALKGGHVIKLGPGNDDAARSALKTYPQGLQIGGGITAENAPQWLEAGASHVIVTSWLFPQGEFSTERLSELVSEVGSENIVLDLSCRKVDDGWVIAMDRWQTLTSLSITHATLDELAGSCAEFLIHAADVEGLCGGIDKELVRFLGEWGRIPLTYAGGAQALGDLELVKNISNNGVDLTIGSALDIFGGTQIAYRDCVTFNCS